MGKFILTDDVHERLSLLISTRLPWLLLGLIGGIAATLLVAKFEILLSDDISVAFFLPIIVYMSDAVGTQTETVYVRNLAKYKNNFFKYLVKEIFVGLIFGLILGGLMFIFAFVWLHSLKVASTVGIAMFINGAIAPIVALVVPQIMFKEHTDPAIGAGPFTTIIQDLISLLVYFIIAVIIIL